MKLSHILKTVLFTFVILQFSACQKDDSAGGGPPAAVGELKASVNGAGFTSSAGAELSSSGILTITGEKPDGSTIILRITGAEEGEFPMGERAAGVYIPGDDIMGAYSSLLDGKVKIDQLSRTDSILIGTFNFKGSRMKMGDDGMPMMNNGFPVMEEINITNGSFNIENLISVGDDGGDPGDPDDPGDNGPEHEFSAKVGNRNFEPTKVLVQDTTIAQIPMFRIQAKTTGREMIRLDIPKALGVGIHQMVKISDGTKLIGIYKTESGESLSSSPGTLEITEFDLEEGFLKAKFSFTAVDPLGRNSTTVRITEGKLTIFFEGTQGANNLLKAKVDGSNYLPEAVLVEREVINQYPRVIMKTQVGDQALEIAFPETVRVGTYDMATEATRGNEVIGIFVPVVGTSIKYYSESGTFTITEINRQTGVVSGEFKYNAVDASGQDPTEYDITEGIFTIQIP